MSDEPGYFSYAIRWAQGNAARIEPIDDSKSPMVWPALIPVVAKPLLDSTNDPHGFVLLKAGRVFMYAYMAICGFFMLLWLVKLVGTKHWILPLTLLLIDPLVISHAMVVGTDTASMAMLLATVYTAMRFATHGSLRYWLWCCVFSALACITKASLIMALWIPVLALVINLRLEKRIKILVLLSFRHLLLLAVTILLVINTAYYFEGSFSPIGNWPHKSESFSEWYKAIQPLHGWPSPLPYHYVTSFDELSYHAELGGGPMHENTYVGINVLGQLQTHGSTWYYYLVAFLVKWPLLIWLLAVLSFFRFVRKISPSNLMRYLWLWLPPLFFFLMMSFRNPFQIGIRHALLLYPFLYLGIGFVFVRIFMHRRKLFTGLMFFHLVSVAIFWPNLVAYSNEMFWPKWNIYRYINDSSISYGNTQQWVEKFIAQNPEYQIPDSIPRAGKFAVSMERATSPWNTWGLNWLGKNFEPVGLYMHTVMLYHVTEEQLLQKNMKP